MPLCIVGLLEVVLDHKSLVDIQAFILCHIDAAVIEADHSARQGRIVDAERAAGLELLIKPVFRRGLHVLGCHLLVVSVLVWECAAPGRNRRSDCDYIRWSAPDNKECRNDAEHMALSFVRSAADVLAARQFISEAGGNRQIPLIAKIEKHEALPCIDAIVDAADGIMVARGDLGVEIPVESVPALQKDLIMRANAEAKPVITATHMLRSMIKSPRPTRAEASDVANAILDGTDAVMLSEETAEGEHPVAAVKMMCRLADATEESASYGYSSPGSAEKTSHSGAVARAAAILAAEIDAAAILTCTQSGSTTRLVAKCRPRVPIIALTPDERTYRRLALVWGAIPLAMAPAASADAMEQQALATALEAGLLRKGNHVVITAGLPLHVAGTTNMLRVAAVGG